MRRLLSLCCLSFLISFTAVEPPRAEAQASAELSVGGMDLHLFRPALDSKGYLTVNGTDILGHNDFSFGLILDGGFGIYPVNGFINSSERSGCGPEGTCTNGYDTADRLVNTFGTGTLHFNYGLFNQLVVGLQLPVHVVSGPALELPALGGMGESIYNDRGIGLDYQGLGNITLHAKYRILRSERHPIGMAAILHLELPTGAPESFAGETGFSIWPVLAMEWRPSESFRLGLNVGYRLALGDGAPVPYNASTVPGNSDGSATQAVFNPLNPDFFTYDDVLTFGLGMSFGLGDSVDLVLEVYGNQILSEFGTEGAMSAEALLGLKVFVQAQSYLVLAGGVGVPNVAGITEGGVQSADIRAMLGFIFEPSIGDRDGDGYKDDIDQCPAEPEDFDEFADEDGCPDPDNDRDGILDEDDECDRVPEDRDGDADEDGCPEGNEGDRDGDGILDDVDECPDEPEDRDGFEDENGCPDPDNDQDRILDPDDSCPNDPETYNGTEDEDGCPDRGRVIIQENQIVILEKVYFDTDSAVIQTRSYPLLDAVAATLNGSPQITLVEVQGHADERSSDEYNIRLTRDRAAAVVEALVQRGVDRSRLRSAGYGERCPVDPRSNAAAWDANRRVEFKIIRTEDGPTGVEVACPAGRELIPE